MNDADGQYGKTWVRTLYAEVTGALMYLWSMDCGRLLTDCRLMSATLVRTHLSFNHLPAAREITGLYPAFALLADILFVEGTNCTNSKLHVNSKANLVLNLYAGLSSCMLHAF